MNSSTSRLTAQVEWLVTAIDSDKQLDAEVKFRAVEGWDFVIRVFIVYVVGVAIMKRRVTEWEPLDLHKFRTVWNIFLSTCSAIGMLAIVPETFQILWRDGGLHSCICDLEQLKTPEFQRWIKYFGYLKLVEFGDSILAVVEKKPVNYLHIYHHITMLFIGRAAVFHFPVARLIVASNLVINFLMYACLALEDNGMISKGILNITTRQQAIPRAIMLSSCLYVFMVKYNGQACDAPRFGLMCVFVVVLLYFFAFFRTLNFHRGEERGVSKQE